MSVERDAALRLVREHGIQIGDVHGLEWLLAEADKLEGQSKACMEYVAAALVGYATGIIPTVKRDNK